MTPYSQADDALPMVPSLSIRTEAPVVSASPRRPKDRRARARRRPFCFSLLSLRAHLLSQVRANPSTGSYAAMQVQIHGILNEFREWVAEHFPAVADWERNDHRSSLLAGAREALLTTMDIVQSKVPAVYQSGRQAEMRPDRNCSVEVALLDDLLTLERFAHDFLERPIGFGHERAVSRVPPLFPHRLRPF
jgi:ATP-dependent Clp protease adapter protein ClpS